MPELNITDIRANPDQPRKHFDENKLRELAASIREHGLMQPVTVRPACDGTYVLVAGERRYRAHVLAGFPTIRAEVVQIDDKAAAEQAIVENLQRVDISPLEEAAAYQNMLDRYGYTVEQLAKRIGMKQPWRITERTSLLKLDPAYQQLVAREKPRHGLFSILSRCFEVIVFARFRGFGLQTLQFGKRNLRDSLSRHGVILCSLQGRRDTHEALSKATLGHGRSVPLAA